MKKKFHIVLACIFFFSILNTNSVKGQAYSNKIITPLWENTNYVDINAYTNNSSIKIEATVDSNNISSNINGTVYLEKFSNGR